MILLYLASIIVLLMLIWFNTDFVVDWGTIFGLSKFVKEHEYTMEKINCLPSFINYPRFLKLKYPSFFTKLLGCPLCVSFWLSVLFCLPAIIFHPILFVFIPPLCILSLFIYGVITKLVNIS